MFYRALHIMSTQRFRLPVRRYIYDLFNIDLDKQVVDELLKHAKELQALPGTDSVANRQSMINHTTHLESDEEEDDFGEMTRSQVEEQPALSLRPVSRIVGFAAA
jgi:rapamycin-insensitive companion of mTOR